MRQHPPRRRAMSTTAPPTAIPTMAPVDSFLEDGELVGEVVLVAEGVGIARVGVRDATAARCVK